MDIKRQLLELCKGLAIYAIIECKHKTLLTTVKQQYIIDEVLETLKDLDLDLDISYENHDQGYLISFWGNKFLNDIYYSVERE